MPMNRQQVEQHIQWKLQAGNCSFWWDNWLGIGPLAQFTTNSNSFNNSTVADFWEEGKWSWSKMIRQVPASQFSNILTTEIFPQQHIPDRALARIDSIEHTFKSGQFAAKVWSYFAGSAGLHSDHSSLQLLLQQWWTTKSKNAAHKLLLQATPIFICWKLWKNRCACKYGGKATNIIRVKYAVYKDNFKMLNSAFPHLQWPAKWTDLIQKSEKCVHEIKVNMVKWLKPANQWLKVNTDGSALMNLGRLGAGGILRDKHGKLVMAFTTPLGEGTNNKAEIEAAIFGLTWALELGYRNIILELDSQLLVHWILKKAVPRWSIITQLGRLQQLIAQVHNFKCTHVFREANCVADALS
ncbi:uncharacterized protein LOC107019451 [Solanum pennellii]|uniref:Uncharacterized protein LOC107019451 n=1 Tax=Solanum pennellii TaxID=28526 RepID=A0ABM1GSU0_SOLPN|nr:uncharacterized protein LOC107019451 [Solanum pennellii]